jgi:hypothetical protein
MSAPGSTRAAQTRLGGAAITRDPLVRTWHSVILAPWDVASSVTSSRVPPHEPGFALHDAA